MATANNNTNEKQPAAPTVVLTNKQTAEQFECTYIENCRVHVPGHYNGLLSDVPPNVADIMISQGHKAFVKKAN